ncbi:isopenicillin N synthase family dioxygenase [Mycobacterium shigaense]|uniref:2-oxobutyrate oxidase n=1 Tax=Mycobacterium shigaense TaxID=722731 RepID=A0A1Z4ECC6_9MYCO|nr:2-oxoglutarate and iron-dependent oxygenase domain-containing protein [Mycobacterium shigaense]MEA1122514.1 2-oxoglutarate and iron-dependent oxygenase domain-containing protein [Mycobacterium shigaense]PRI17164.1 oxidoreductase [Mycobacterium shigaense]BAX90610.1 2-oxobutyrate oxidase [Mycobacterium shigaense]
MTSVAAGTALPVVDLRAPSGQLRQTLREAAHEVGFFYLTGHDVPATLVDRLLAAARELFSLPQADKDAIAMARSPHFRGYTRLGGELTRGQVDWREQIDIGPERPPAGGPGAPDYLWLQGPNQWPSALPELPAIVAEWDAALSAVARTLLRHWAASLGAAPDVFDAAFAGAPATLIKIIRYPARAASPQGVGAHRDSGVLTLLLAEPGSRGLQVRRAADGWIEVPPLPGAFIVNIGELLELATGGYLRATEHRVNLAGRAAERISVPFFFNPRLDAQIPVLTLPPELLALAPRAGNRWSPTEDPADPIFSIYGRNAWKSRLRAHPDVADAHGYSAGRVNQQ